MNRLLADTLSFLNGLIAAIIISAGAAVGYFSLAFASLRLAGLSGRREATRAEHRAVLMAAAYA